MRAENVLPTPLKKKGREPSLGAFTRNCTHPGSECQPPPHAGPWAPLQPSRSQPLSRVQTFTFTHLRRTFTLIISQGDVSHTQHNAVGLLSIDNIQPAQEPTLGRQEHWDMIWGLQHNQPDRRAALAYVTSPTCQPVWWGGHTTCGSRDNMPLPSFCWEHDWLDSPVPTKATLPGGCSSQAPRTVGQQAHSLAMQSSPLGNCDARMACQPGESVFGTELWLEALPAQIPSFPLSFPRWQLWHGLKTPLPSPVPSHFVPQRCPPANAFLESLIMS